MGKKKKQKQGGPEQSGSHRHLPESLTLPTAIPLKYQAIVSIFLLLVGVCVLYPELVFQNKVILAGDVEAAASFATPIKKAMQEGESDPLWNPYLFAGMPSYGSLSYTPGVYPVGVLTGFLSKVLGFPNFTWLLFHILLLGVGVWLVLLDRGVHFLIAAGAGVLMMWMPNHVAVGVHGHGSQACAVAYMPFVLLFWDRLWRGKGVMLNAAVLVVLLGFQLLRGHLQIAYYTFAIMGLHFLFFSVLKIRDGVKGALNDEEVTFGAFRNWYAGGTKKRTALVEVFGAAGVLAIVVAGAMLISAVLFLPVQDFAEHSIRGASETGGLDYDYATSWSLHPLESLTFIVPFSSGFGKAYYFGHMPFTDYPNYLGIISVFFAVVALILVRTRFVRFLLFLVIVTTLVAYGKYLPILYNPLFNFMPYFNKFRVPVMALIVQQLAVVLLFGVGLSAVLSVNPESGRKKAMLVAAGSIVLLLLVLISYGYWTNGFPRAIASKLKFVRSAPEQLQFAREVGGFLMRDLVKVSLLLVSTSALLVLVFKRSMPPLVMVVFVLVLAMADLFMVDRYIIHPEALFSYERGSIIQEKSVRDRFLEPDDVMRYLQAQEGEFRVFPMTHPSVGLNQDFRTNRYMNFGISSIGGYHPAKLTIYEEFMQAMGVALQRGNLQPVNMLNVRYIVSANPLPENPVWLPRWDGTDYEGKRRYVYENIEAMPRLFFVDQVEIAAGTEALNRMLAPGVNLSKSAFVDRAPAVTPVSAEGAQARVTSRRFNEIRVDASLPSAALLVLSEIYYPRWKVEVDGQPGEILRANHILRGVSLPAGEHELVFSYNDSLLKKSRLVSRVTLLVAVIVMMVAVLMQLRGRAQWKHSS
jgi:hypothetical protein